MIVLLSAVNGVALRQTDAHDLPDAIFASKQTLPAQSMADTLADDSFFREETEEKRVETIVERYSDGAKKVSRQVTQDEDLNYVNHGTWATWNQHGEKVSEGEYRLGKRHGRWTRLHSAAELRKANFPIRSDFQQPFLSEAHFRDGQLDATWRITDRHGRPVAQWEFDEGKLHGVAVLYFANGSDQYKVHYEHGVLHGALSHRNESGKLVRSREFRHGQELALRQERHPNGTVVVEGTILRAKRDVELEVDWWKARVHTTFSEPRGEDIRYGKWTFRHPNGTKKLELSFKEDLPQGPVLGWHPNGQKLVAGHYLNGEKHGEWTWWHTNGQKHLEGRFADGAALGQWIEWRDSGRVAHVRDHRPPQGTPGDERLYSNNPQPATDVSRSSSAAIR